MISTFKTCLFVAVGLAGISILSSCSPLLLPIATESLRSPSSNSEVRYLTLDLAAVVEGRRISLTHKWHCEGKSVVSMRDGNRVFRWRRSQEAIVDVVDAQTAIYVKLPELCSETQQYRPDLVIVNLRDPSTVRVFPGADGRFGQDSGTIQQGLVSFTSSNQDTLLSTEEAGLLKTIESNRYEAPVGIEFKEDAWSLSPVLMATLDKLRGVTFSAEASHETHNGVQFFSGYYSMLDERRRAGAVTNKYVFLSLEKDFWSFDFSKKSATLINAGKKDSLHLNQISPTKIRYKGREFDMGADSSQVYDGDLRVLYQISELSL